MGRQPTQMRLHADFCKSKTKHVYDVVHRLNTDWLKERETGKCIEGKKKMG